MRGRREEETEDKDYADDDADTLQDTGATSILTFYLQLEVHPLALEAEIWRFVEEDGKRLREEGWEKINEVRMGIDK